MSNSRKWLDQDTFPPVEFDDAAESGLMPFALMGEEVGERQRTLPVDVARRLIAGAQTWVEDPTADNDRTEGWHLGSFWWNMVTDRLFVCTNTVEGEAEWEPVEQHIPVHVRSDVPTVADPSIKKGDLLLSDLGFDGPILQATADGGPPWVTVSAGRIPYDNTESELAAEDVQAAIDELAAESGGGGGASELDDLTDVTAPSPSDGQALVWNASESRWEPETIAGSGDMLKSVYDTNDDGIVDAADVAERVEEAVETEGTSGATHTIDCGLGTIHLLTLTDDCTLSFDNVPSGGFGITLELVQDGTGSRTVTWPASVTWAGGTAPTLSTDANAVDVVTLYTPDGGTTWRGFLAGLDFS